MEEFLDPLFDREGLYDPGIVGERKFGVGEANAEPRPVMGLLSRRAGAEPQRWTEDEDWTL